ncbi:adrenocorticotropic hormone receptor-like [Actinia tenebrosa]|uniref:Adrenocorticotropic hormone receptor-like n=1 Tax=Actinia tenebrosa TaxID=6105 RepID=A0A6P8IJT3_ACTTE|nr:adrenocorticotropic hormone receptor-like [Actinia tenebrosa]
MSLLGSYPCSNISAPTSLSITSAAICSVLTVTAVVGNILVLLAVVIDPNRNLRSPFNFLVANLAAADLIVGCFALPMSVEFYVREALEGTSVKPWDHARRVGYFISSTASLLSLAALTVDRFVAITYPMKYRAKLSPKRTLFVSVSLWTVSIAFPFLYFEVGYLKYQFVFANTAVIATFIVLCLTYAKVFKSFKSQVRSWDTLHTSSEENQIKRRTILWEKKVTKTFLIMLTLFISCFLPSLILIYIISFCGNCNCIFIHWARDINYYLTMANSTMNPFVFAWRLKTYRSAFMKILTCGEIGKRMVSVTDSFMSWKGQFNVSMTSLGPPSSNSLPGAS